jgi:hypothetical protein
MPVSEDQGSPGTDVINIAIAIRIKNQTAFGAIDENRFGPDRFTGSHRAVDAAGN